MADTHSLPRFWRDIRARLSDRPDSEHEQAGIRVGIGALLLLYYGLAPMQGMERGTPSFAVLGPLFAMTLLLLGHIVAYPARNPWRRLVGTVLDVSAITYFFFSSDAAAIPMYALYLWVIFGNGFRFGRRYLYFALALSLIGFGSAVLILPHWRENQPLGWGLWGGMFAVSLYVAHLVKRLTSALQNSEAANMAKRRFVSSVSHELRTPLNAIIGMADLLRTTRLDSDQQDMLHTLHEASCLMLALIEDVLDFSKIEAGKLTLEDAEFDLRDLVERTIDVFRYQALSKGLALTSTIGPGLPERLRGDPRHLRQILVNLLSNAIKFTEHGEVACRVFCMMSSADQALIRFEVVDTGIGIAKEAQSRIFDSFTQADESTTRSYGGTGLGTTIAKQLVELMGGTISVSSEPGKGSLFWFELGLRRAAPAHAPVAAHVESLPVSPAAASGKAGARVAKDSSGKRRLLHVLVAEDNPTNSKVIQQILLRAGHRFTLATNGEQALDLLVDTRFDVVLMDRNMPAMNGLEVARAYQYMVPESRRAPVVMFSADATMDARKECARAGIAAYLPKPVQMRTLLELLDSLVPSMPAESDASGATVEAAVADPPAETTTLDLDVSVLADLETLGSDPGFVRMLLAGYMKDNAALIAQFEAAMRAHRLQECRDLLHAMKGSAVSVGALRMREFCERTETLPPCELFRDQGRINSECRQLFAALCNELKAYCAVEREGAPPGTAPVTFNGK